MAKTYSSKVTGRLIGQTIPGIDCARDPYPQGWCPSGTEMVNGVCVPIRTFEYTIKCDLFANASSPGVTQWTRTMIIRTQLTHVPITVNWGDGTTVGGQGQVALLSLLSRGGSPPGLGHLYTSNGNRTITINIGGATFNWPNVTATTSGVANVTTALRMCRLFATRRDITEEQQAAFVALTNPINDVIIE